MPGISFIQAGFLAAGALAAALPVLIHLLMRQRARQIEIGSVRFLQSVIRQHTRRRRIRQWLLLALRVLALLLLGALFARPFLDRSHLEGMNREVVLLVDRSASMNAKTDDGGTALSAAWKAMHDRLDKLDENTTIRVALFDAAGVTEVPREKLDEPPAESDAATDYSVGLAWARDVLTNSARPNRAVYLFSDLQKSGLSRGGADDFPPGIEVTVQDVGRALARNVAVADARATTVEIRPKSPVTVTVRLQNTGALPAKRVKVSLLLQGPPGEIQANQMVDVPPGRQATVAFPLDVQIAGVYRGEVTHNHRDDLAFDDRRFVAFQASHPDRVLLVDGQQGRSVYGNETYYLETALRLNTPTGDAPPRSYEVERIVWEDGEGFPDLTGFRGVVLANLRRLRSLDAQRLKQYADGGGNLLIFTGDQTAPEFLAALRGAGLVSTNVALDPAVGSFNVTRFDKDHAVLQPFADPQHGDLRRLSFRKINRLTSVGDSAKVVMWSGDLPLMVENAAGAGIVLLVATAADRDWSDWPQDRLYVPLVRQMLAYLTGQLGVRQTVRQEIVDRPGEKAGVEQSGGVTVARNIDPRESLLARATDEEFRRTLGLAAQDKSESNEELAAQYAPAGAERPDEAWTAVVWLLLAVLACETLLASRVHA